MDAIYRPFTTVTVSNLPARTTDVTFFHPEHARGLHAGSRSAGGRCGSSRASGRRLSFYFGLHANVDGDEGASADADENANVDPLKTHTPPSMHSLVVGPSTPSCRIETSGLYRTTSSLSLYRTTRSPPHSADDHEQYTRVLRLRAYDPALARRLTRLRGQVAQYGVLEGVQL
ncbi:hypothetical protein B0H14DRAFT_3873915 [Mycena olivaceomarginata]|nr:hypothetical protein B0H14DRAFT_3873915 [Mycena olivaceomarginata]